MNAIATTTNVIAVDFAKSAPVLTSYAEASRPTNEIALRLAAEARGHADKVSLDKKAGTLRNLAKDAGGRTDLFNLNPYSVSIKEGWNSRVANDPANIEHIDLLARSIAVEGVLQPLTVVVEGNEVFVTDGHCRLLAVFRAIEVYNAEIKSIPLRAEGRHATEADRVMSQILRNSGKPLTVLEQGSVFVKLTKFGWTAKQIAEKAGVGMVRVSQILDLMAGANEAIKALVSSGRISASQAAQTLRDMNGDAAAAEKVLAGAVTVAEAAGKTRATKKHVSGETGVKVSAKVALRAILTAKTTVVETVGKTTNVSLPTAQWAAVLKLLNA